MQVQWTEQGKLELLHHNMPSKCSMLSFHPLYKMMKLCHTQYRHKTLAEPRTCWSQEMQQSHVQVHYIWGSQMQLTALSWMLLPQTRQPHLCPLYVFWKPSLTASARCKVILISASSWLKGARWLVSHRGTSELFVATTCLLVTKCVMCLCLLNCEVAIV